MSRQKMRLRARTGEGRDADVEDARSKGFVWAMSQFTLSERITMTH